MGFSEELQKFVQLLESDKISSLSKESFQYDINIKNCKVKVVPGKKYVKVDIGGSGAYMVDNNTGDIYGIKAYGVLNKGQHFGTLDTIYNYKWGGYRATKLDRETKPFLFLSVDEILKGRGVYQEPEKVPEKIEKIFTKDKYKELCLDLKKAAIAGKEASLFVDDSGTCNMDGVFLTLPKFNEGKTIAAIYAAGLSGFKHKSSWFGAGFLISPPVVGQARKREVAAETMYKYLKSLNYNVSHWQQMD